MGSQEPKLPHTRRKTNHPAPTAQAAQHRNLRQIIPFPGDWYCISITKETGNFAVFNTRCEVIQFLIPNLEVQEFHLQQLFQQRNSTSGPRSTQQL